MLTVDETAEIVNDSNSDTDVIPESSPSESSSEDNGDF
jgi:hypothetical protein